MRHAMGAKPREMIGNGFAGAGKNKRGTAAHRAQVNLQTAVTANIVERTPNVGAIGRTRHPQRGGERCKIVDDHLRHAGGAGGHHDPFSVNARRRIVRQRLDRGFAHDARETIKRRVRRRALVHHGGVDTGDGDDGGKMCRIGVRRQDDNAARNALQLDQRERAGELAFRRQQRRASGELAQTAAETRAAREIGEAQRRIAIVETARRAFLADDLAQRRRINAGHAHRLSRNRRA